MTAGRKLPRGDVENMTYELTGDDGMGVVESRIKTLAKKRAELKALCKQLKLEISHLKERRRRSGVTRTRRVQAAQFKAGERA
jgi:hypothetical protein